MQARDNSRGDVKTDEELWFNKEVGRAKATVPKERDKGDS